MAVNDQWSDHDLFESSESTGGTEVLYNFEANYDVEALMNTPVDQKERGVYTRLDLTQGRYIDRLMFVVAVHNY